MLTRLDPLGPGAVEIATWSQLRILLVYSTRTYQVRHLRTYDSAALLRCAAKLAVSTRYYYSVLIVRVQVPVL